MLEASVVLCRNCGQKSEVSDLEPGNRFIQMCKKCQGWTLTSSVKDFDAQAIYSEDYFQGTEYLSYEKGLCVHKKNFERKIKILQKYVKTPIADWKLLELGSATGAFLDSARQVGVKQMLGVEVSEYAQQKAQENNLPVLLPSSSNLKSKLQELKPEILVGWDVWEHLENPVEFMRDWIANQPSLKYISFTTVDSGALIPKFKKTQWRQYHPPSHLNYPTRKSFEIFMKECGFKIVYHSNFGYVRPLAEYLVSLSPRIRERVLQTNWPFKIPLYLNLYDSQMFIAEKIHN